MTTRKHNSPSFLRVATPALCVSAALLLIAAIAGPRASAEESVYLQSGEQYQATVQGMSDGALRAKVGAEEKSFPLDSVQRIEFQKAREFDGLESTDALAQASPLFADALAPKTDDLKKTYPQAGHVILKSELVLKLNADGTYAEDTTTVWRILDQRAADTSFQTLYFLPEYQKAAIAFGITVGPDGKVERVSDGAVKVEAVYPSYPEYNHEQRVRFAMKNPVPGATLFLKTEITGKATDLVPLVVDSTFWSDEPALERVVRIEGDPAALKSACAVATGGLKADESGTAWRLTDTPQIFGEPVMPPLSNFAPRVVIAWPASTWKMLAVEFAERIGFRPVKSPKGETAQDAFARVRSDVRLVGVPQDALPTAPAAPETVLKRGYGTETEKALLLEALLKGLGANASTVLVHSRNAGEFVTAVPRLRGINHALVRLESTDGSYVWLQPDVTKRGFGELSSEVQGGKGLDLRSGELVDVPVLDPGVDGSIRTVDVTIGVDGNAFIKDTTTATGTEALSLRSLGDLSDEELQKWAAEYVGSGLPGVTLTSFTHSDFDKVNTEEFISFAYRAPGLAQISGDFLVLRLPNAKYVPSEVGRSAHQYDLFWLGRESEATSFTVRAPAGYQVYAVGRGAEKEGDGWSLVSGFSIPKDTAGVVVFSDEWTRSTLDAPKDAYPQYREALIQRGVLRDEMIVFEKLPVELGTGKWSTSSGSPLNRNTIHRKPGQGTTRPSFGRNSPAPPPSARGLRKGLQGLGNPAQTGTGSRMPHP
jgi:hypothetical protein